MASVQGIGGRRQRWLDPIKGAAHALRLSAGYLYFLVRGKTPYFAYRSMSQLFCLTGGHSNDMLSRVIGFFRKPYAISAASGILGEMDSGSREHVLSSLRRHGYHVFPTRLPDELCDRLLAFATSQRCDSVPVDGDPSGTLVSAVYPRQSPLAARYEFDSQSLLHNRDVQDIVADHSLVAVAQDYLEAKPVLDVLSMWWHTAFLGRPDSRAAQFFHFDMDRPKWLKFFIFLTDVDTLTGPHVFVEGSHRTGAIPASLRGKGQVRYSDEEVGLAFPGERQREFTVARGTVVAEDTRGLHKGKHVEAGDRLILQVQFSNSLFGMTYPDARLDGQRSDALVASMARFPEVYDAYR